MDSNSVNERAELLRESEKKGLTQEVKLLNWFLFYNQQKSDMYKMADS